MAMNKNDYSALFADIREFGWNPEKREVIYSITRSTSRTSRKFSTAPPSSADRIVMAKSGTKSSDISKGGKSRSPARSAARSAGSSRHGGHVATNDENITIVSRDSPRKGKTDWAAVDALTDDDIAKAVANDPDAVPIDIDWSDAVLVIPPKKQAISIRVDEDVLNFFKKEGDGYQRRINAVLRSYMQQKAKPKKRA
jgi:uncharacterized protein (DUF4415 family)